MEVHVLDQQVSVSGQMGPAEVEQLTDLGVEILICNRPDHEEAGQPLYGDVAASAQSAGIEVHNIPFAGGQMTMDQVQEFADLMGQGRRIHAYCRTGNRCTQIWGAAKQLQE